MKGLILKDLLILKNQVKNLIFIIIIFFAMAAVNKDFSFVAVLIPFYIVMLIVSTFSYDEYNHWDSFCNTLPYTRKDIVSAKYLLFLFGIVTALIVGTLASVVETYVDKTVLLEDSLFSLVGEVGGIAITLSLFIPFLYKFGSQKGRTVLMTVVFAISLLLGLLIKIFGANIDSLLNALNSLNILVTILCIIVIMILIIYVSYRISIKIYSNKEF